MQKNERSTKLLTLFDALGDNDKDIVLTVSELLASKCSQNITKSGNSITDGIGIKSGDNFLQHIQKGTNL